MAVESTIRHTFMVRRGRVADIEAILVLAKATSGAAQWSRAEYASSCLAADADKGRVKALFIASELASRTVVGFAAFTAVLLAGEYELANMAVGANCQRQGIGSRLLAAGCLWCHSWGPAIPSASAASAGEAQKPFEALHPSLWLEVRSSNSGAIAFYEHAGFTDAGMRADYYVRPAEDARIMWRPLTEGAIGGKLPQ